MLFPKSFTNLKLIKKTAEYQPLQFKDNVYVYIGLESVLCVLTVSCL